MPKYDHVEALKAPAVKKTLPRYVRIIVEDLPARFQIAKRIVFNPEGSMSTKKMWAEHDRLMQNFHQAQLMIDRGKLKLEELEVPRFSLFDLKILLAEDMLKSCKLCERACGVNRMAGETGICKVQEFENCLVSSEFTHLGEEAHISPSHTIFFMGCNFHCEFCQNFSISQWYEHGVTVDPKMLAAVIKRRKSEGAMNVNWVGGEPTVHLPAILKTIKHVDVNIPQIWNSNFYMSIGTMKLLDGVVDMFLSDFKYGNDNCAAALSKAKNYFEVCTRNHLIAAEQAELTVRHLLLPGHVECCTKPVLNWLAKNVRGKALVNIMNQYHPMYKAHEHTDISRTVEKEEIEEALNYAKKLKLNCTNL